MASLDKLEAARDPQSLYVSALSRQSTQSTLDFAPTLSHLPILPVRIHGLEHGPGSVRPRMRIHLLLRENSKYLAMSDYHV